MVIKTRAYWTHEPGEKIPPGTVMTSHYCSLGATVEAIRVDLSEAIQWREYFDMVVKELGKANER